MTSPPDSRLARGNANKSCNEGESLGEALPKVGEGLVDAIPKISAGLSSLPDKTWASLVKHYDRLSSLDWGIGCINGEWQVYDQYMGEVEKAKGETESIS